MLQVIHHALVLGILFGFLLQKIEAQKEAMQFQANECRHVAILARAGFNGSYTARCHLPTRRFSADTVNLSAMIHDEWKWVLNHQGAITGQVLVRSHETVYILSQKDCLDPGRANGRPYRSVYAQVGGNAPRSGVYGSFNFSEDNSQDAYRECVSNNAQWHTFRKWNTNETLPTDFIQMVRKVHGGHNGTGQQLTPYNFNYDNIQLNRVFRRLVNDALRNKSVNITEDVLVESGKPITLTNYPFETGISIIGPRSKAASGEFVRDFTQDNSNLAWNRALQAKSALSNRENPPPPLPSELKTGELVSITVLTIVAIFLFGRALKEAVRMRQAAIKEWDNPTGRWAFLTSEDRNFHGIISRNGLGNVPRRRGAPKGFRAGTIDILLALITALASMIAAVLEFFESSYRYQNVIVVNSGGLVTYGPSSANFSIDPANPWSGAEFSVNHWLVLNITRTGMKGLGTFVYTVCVFLLLYMVRAFFLYSLRREYELDFQFVRTAFYPLKWTILFCQKVLGGLIIRWFGEEQDPRIPSYEMTYNENFNILAGAYGIEGLDEAEQPKPCEFFTVFQRLDIDRFLEDRRIEVNERPGFRFKNGMNGVTRNEIEKCAEVLAADRFGLLGPVQALTLIYMQSAAKAADRFINKKQIPNADEISQLASIYYVRECIIPDGDGPILTSDAVQIVNIGDEVRGAGRNMLNPAPGNAQIIGAVIGYRPRARDAVEAIELMRDNNGGENVEWANCHNGNVIYLAFQRVRHLSSHDV